MNASTARVGRPRSAASRQAILTTTFDALVVRGYGAMSIDAVASAAAVSKTTVYRWWTCKADLAVDSFFEATKGELQLPDTGSAREDFRRQILGLCELLHGPRGRALAGMLGGARNDPALAQALRQRWLEPRQAWGKRRIRQAITNGETGPDVTAETALALLYSPVYTPLLFGRSCPTRSAMAAILELSLRAVFTDSNDLGRSSPVGTGSSKIG